MYETSVTVVGNVASEVTAKRVGAEEHLLVGFRIASSERRWDKVSATWVDGDRFSAWVSCWRRLGEHVRGSLVKGDPVVVRGRLSVREYEVNGERRFSTELAATAVGPDLSRCTAQLSRARTGIVAPASTEDADGGATSAGSPVAAPGPDEAPLVASAGADDGPLVEAGGGHGADEPADLPAVA